jgi:hypothetical protein
MRPVASNSSQAIFSFGATTVSKFNKNSKSWEEDKLKGFDGEMSINSGVWLPAVACDQAPLLCNV